MGHVGIESGPFDRFATKFKRKIDPHHFLGYSAFDVPWGNRFPKANIKMTDEAYRIDLLVPGFEKDELEVKVEHGVLIVRGEKSDAVRPDNEAFVLEEFDVESFERKFKLTKAHSDHRIEAFYDHGILSIVFYTRHDPVVSHKKLIQVS